MHYHISWGTYGSWLPGDPRGFRTRGHCEHVTGDYKNPPAPGKYKGLHAHAKASLKKPPVSIPPELREIVGRQCLKQLDKEGVEVFVISVDSWHVHVAVDCAAEGLKLMVGRVKKVSSHKVRDRIPGRLWQAGCHPVAVRDERHWHNVLRYILDHAPEAWVWCKEWEEEGE